MDRLTYENLCSLENDVCAMIRMIISENEDDYEIGWTNEDDKYTEIQRLEPDMEITDYDDIMRWKFNEGDDMWDEFEKYMNCQINLKPDVVCKIITEVNDNYGDYDASTGWVDLFNLYVFIHADMIIQEKIECQDERLEKYVEIRKKNCSRVIQRQWEKCRWNPKYQMCHTCQLKDLEENCGVSFDENGKMVKVV